MSDDLLIRWGKEVLDIECETLKRATLHLDDSFVQSVKIIQGIAGRVIVTGLGKSGHVGAKIASTLASTGTPSVFLHASEAMHGDFGIFTKEDCLLAIAYGGETREVLAVAKFAKANQIPVIALTGKLGSSLVKFATATLNGSIEREADSLGLAPTSSSTLALALGDALAVVLMRHRNFTKEHFAQLHPGGDLGRRLSSVEDVMRPIHELNLVSRDDNFHDVLKAVGSPNYGVVAVSDHETRLLGCITDGDLRRILLEFGGEALKLSAKDLMTVKPKVITTGSKVMDAISIMEEYKITSLFVLEPKTNKISGLVRLHDVLAAKII